MKWLGAAVWAAALLLAPASGRADDAALNAALLKIEDRWAEIRYEMKGERERLAAGRELLRQAQAVAAAHPGRAEPLVWHALALLVEAKIRGDVSALGLAKDARRLLEQAEGLDPQALGGMIQTSLGMMYYEMPGWPLGFGDKRRAAQYLIRALEIDPHSMDNNYFYGDYFVMTGKGGEAVPYLERALAAPVRPGHERADTGRKADIQESLDKARLDASRKVR
jgi:tetratricopeptide (TPR) repeat protein